MSEQKKRGENSISRIHQDFVKQEDKKKKQQHNRKVAFYRRLAIMTALFVIIVGSLIFNIVKQQNVLQQKQEEEIALQKELDQEKKQQVELKTQIVKLDDDDYIAKIVRKDLFLSKKGEKIFNIPNPIDDEEQTKVSKSQTE